MKKIVISTPERDATLYDNYQKNYVRRTSAQLKQDAEHEATIMVANAKEKAAKYGLDLLSSRANLGDLRSDEVEEYKQYLEESIREKLGREHRYTVPIFTFFEKITETAVVDNVRDLTFNAVLL